MNLTGNRKEMTRARRLMAAAACGLLGLGTCAAATALRIGVPATDGSEAMSGSANAGASGSPGYRVGQGGGQSGGQGTSEGQGGAGAPVRVSGGVMAGQVLSKVNPVYPPEAKEQKITGTVVLSAVIGKDGTVENLQVVSGPEKLRTSALDAVRQWVYKPYVLNGQPVEVRTVIQVTYSLSVE